jgi:pimeloyl-ACP methyl ester carboxylesterase
LEEGEEDPFQPLPYGERLAWDLPDSRLVRIPHAGHFPMWDQARRVEEALEQFLGVSAAT